MSKLLSAMRGRVSPVTLGLRCNLDRPRFEVKLPVVSHMTMGAKPNQVSQGVVTLLAPDELVTYLKILQRAALPARYLSRSSARSVSRR